MGLLRWFSSWEAQTAIAEVHFPAPPRRLTTACSSSFRESDELDLAPKTHDAHTYMQITHTYKILSAQKSRQSFCLPVSSYHP